MDLEVIALQVSRGRTPDFEELVLRFYEEIQLPPGALARYLVRSQDNPILYWLIWLWQSRADAVAAAATPVWTRFDEEARRLSTSPPMDRWFIVRSAVRGTSRSIR